MAILKDLDNTTYAINPAANEKMAVRVPDWNIPHKTQIPIITNKYLSFLILGVIAMMTKVTNVAAALHP